MGQAADNPKPTRAAYQKAWRAKNLEKVRASEAASRAANPEKYREANRRYRSRHPEVGAARTASYRAAHRVETTLWWYRRGAAKRGLAFALPEALFRDLLTDRCFYCGSDPAPVNGIDRVDNAVGYVEGNVVTACKVCNRAKNAMGREAFEAYLRRAGRWLAQVAA